MSSGAEPRALIAEGLQRYLTKEQIEKLIDEVLAIDKRASAEFTCKDCHKRQMQWTSIPDAKAVVSAVADLLAQGFGRPVEATDKAEPIRFKRITIVDDDEAVEDALRLAQDNRRRFAAQRREDGTLHRAGDGDREAEVAGDPDLQSESRRINEAVEEV